MSQSENTHRLRVARGPVKESITTRSGVTSVVKSKGANNALWQQHKNLKEAGEALVQAGEEMGASEKAAAIAEADALAARQLAVSKRIAFDGRFNVYADIAEIVAEKPEDLTNLGL